MEGDDLNEIIAQLEAKASRGHGMFGIYQGKDFEAGSFIKANNHGLMLFALELLKAAKKFEDKVECEDYPILLGRHENWIDENSEILIGHITPIREASVVSEIFERKETLVDRMLPVGCFLVLLFLIIVLITGLVTIGKHVFE